MQLLANITDINAQVFTSAKESSLSVAVVKRTTLQKLVFTELRLNRKTLAMHLAMFA